ncbi:flavin reductase family protein [Solibacillus sp. FSL K6-1781]|uniref:flavin reductase family protein n=1 Tax=Solibacillus sp. FSL K6-1781 TaxID=2921474 RepID=UPI00315A4B8A
MKKIDPKQISERENYKFLIGSIIPRPIAFVTSISEDGVVNAAPFSFFNIVSSNPPMISVSIQRKKGKPKDTARNIRAKEQFVVHIVDTENVEQVNKTAANLPPDESEIAVAGLSLVKSEKIDVPGVKEAKVRLECVLEKALELGGDDENAGCDLIVGKVVYYHIEESLYEDGRVDPKGLGAISRLAGNDYAKIGEQFTIERPL